MQQTSATYQQILSDDNHYFETKLDIDGVGTINENTIFELSTDSELFEGAPEIGKAIAAEIDVKMLNPDADIPKMACLRPYVRVCGSVARPTTVAISGTNIRTLNTQYATVSSKNITFQSASGAVVSGTDLSFPVSSTEYDTLESEWLPQGVFYIDTREFSQNEDGLDVLSIHGFDAMLKTEQIFTSSSITGDSIDTQMVTDIASSIGVEVDERTFTIMNGSYRIPLPVSFTFREILGYIASMYFGCFIMTEDGKLRLVSLLELPEETNYLIDNIGNAITFGGDRILV